MQIKYLLIIFIVFSLLFGCSNRSEKLSVYKHSEIKKELQEKKIIQNGVDYSKFNKLTINVVTDKGVNANDTEDDWKAIQDALNQVKKEGGGTVLVPKGKYILNHSLKIYKNTRLKLSNHATMIRKHRGALIINGDVNAEYHGYNGHGNIVVEGGTYIMNMVGSSVPGAWFGIGRANGIIIRNIKVMNLTNSHAIDLNSSRNVLIENGQFLGFQDNTSDGSMDYIEAIQISNHTKKGFMAFGAYDGTPSQDITVKNCIFGDSGTKGFGTWAVGVGNHGYGILNLYNERIKIQNNTFDGMTMAGIHINAYKNVTIEGNKFNDNNNVIIMDTPSNNYYPDTTLSNRLQAGERITIKDNIFENTNKENIIFSGFQNEQETAAINNVSIINNRFISTTANNLARDYVNINLFLCKNVVIKNNYLENLDNNVKINQSEEVKVESDISY